jgi:hypothetical protein
MHHVENPSQLERKAREKSTREKKKGKGAKT